MSFSLFIFVSYIMRYLVAILLFSHLISFSQGCDSLLEQSITNPGIFSFSSYNESSGIRNGPDYSGSTIFYPTNNLVDLASVIIVPGFANNELTIQNWGPFLSSNGIVTMTIGTNSLTDSHVDRRDALLDAIISLKEENQRLNSPLYNRIDTTRIALGGFSKGGGGAQLAAVSNSDLKAIFALYPWLDNPTSNDLNHNVPVIIISGQLDAIAPPSIHADIHYSLTPQNTDKLKYEILFASHDALSGPNGGNGDVGVKVLSWLQTYLIEDSCYCPLLLSPASTSSEYLTNVSCDFINTIEENINIGANLFKIVDVFGRETKNKENIPLFYIYENGLVEKRIIIQ